MSETILVTGAASGIGRAVVEAALAEGWRAVATDRDAAALADLDGPADRLLRLPLDVADEAAVVAVVAQAEAFAPLTGVVNSAGIALIAPMLETSTALFRTILEVNVIGMFSVSREVVRAMLPRGKGAVVNIASVSGIKGNVGRSAYGASKGGVITMTKVWAAELGASGIRVNAIAPGPIDTAMAREVHLPSVRQAWCEVTAQRRYGEPEEVAAAAIFLLDGRKSSYVTGQTLAVDGGFSTAGLMV